MTTSDDPYEQLRTRAKRPIVAIRGHQLAQLLDERDRLSAQAEHLEQLHARQRDELLHFEAEIARLQPNLWIQEPRMSNLAFLDLETTGLDRDRHQIWEIGLIVRDGEGNDRETLWRVWPDLATADPTALRINRFYERIAEMPSKPYESPDSIFDLTFAEGKKGFGWSDPNMLAAVVAFILDDAHIVGSNPSFDDAFLSRWLRANGQAATWHYHLIDVGALAYGYLAADQTLDRIKLPWRTDDLAELVHVDRDWEKKHTALGDARFARDVYDAVVGK